jgi:hypothetical protein
MTARGAQRSTRSQSLSDPGPGIGVLSNCPIVGSARSCEQHEPPPSLHVRLQASRQNGHVGTSGSPGRVDEVEKPHREVASLPFVIAIGILRRHGHRNIAAALRRNARDAARLLPLLGITSP